MNGAEKTLISFSGRNLVDINFVSVEIERLKTYRRACNKARAAKKPLPPKEGSKFARATKNETLSLRPGTTAIVTADELTFIKKNYPEAYRCIVVHPGVVGKLSRAERKAAEEKEGTEVIPKPEPSTPLPSPEDSKGKGKGKVKVNKGTKTIVPTG